MQKTIRAGILLSAVLLGGCAAGGDAGGDGSAPATAQAVAAPAGAELGYLRGAPEAPITVVEFSDFGCPYCAQFALQTYPELHREFVESGQVSWRYVPFELGSFPNGDLAARASECAADQERFWEMHDALFAEQRAWRRTDEPDALFATLAGRLGLDAQAFRECYDSGRTTPRTEAANALAADLGVRATPTFFINGRRIEGALPPDQFRMLLQWAGAGAQ